MIHPDTYRRALQEKLRTAELGLQGQTPGPWWVLFEAICELQAETYRHQRWILEKD